MVVVAFSVAAFAGASGKLPAVSSGSVAAVLEPYLENHTLAGAVTLIAGKDSILDIPR
jgi:hypothetical protein